MRPIKKDSVGFRIRMLRIHRDLTIRELAALIGMRGPALGLVERNINDISTQRIIDICDVLQTSPNYLIWGEE